MKYRVLLRTLKILVQLKRFAWWVGAGIFVIAWKSADAIIKPFVYIKYKIQYLFKKIGIGQTKSQFLKRNFLQIIIFALVFYISLGHSAVLARKDLVFAGQKTIAYSVLSPTSEEFDLEEVISNSDQQAFYASPSWRSGSLNNQSLSGGVQVLPQDQDLTSVVAGGSALTKPIILPGATVGSSGFSSRTQVVEYTVEPGDSLSSIAYQFGVSVPTIMWENGLTLRSVLKLGATLKIPPATGVMHTVKKGDTLAKIGKLYGSTTDEIIKFNKLKENGTDLIVGEKILIPNGEQPQAIVIARVPKTTASFNKVATPPSSRGSASASGFVWPTGARILTQYYTYSHHGLDIAGPWQTPNYAAKAGVVEKSQCGWNSGYGCQIIIDHGGGVKTLYGHNSKLLVSVGENVEAGQTIGLMGNTGKVRGRTGIHLHFEIIINGARVNPLGYVRP